MASWIRALLTSTLLAFCIATASAQAAPAPIVFDFEDGLQGWTLRGSALRVQTQVLGGDWAIFADGRTVQENTSPYIIIETDLTDIASISVEQFFVAANENKLVFFHQPPGGATFGVRLHVVEPGNPSLRAVDVSSITGVADVGFLWGGHIQTPLRAQVGDPREHLDRIVAFIDNITFHPVPEPGTLGLLAVSLAALGMYRRWVV